MDLELTTISFSLLGLGFRVYGFGTDYDQF